MSEDAIRASQVILQYILDKELTGTERGRILQEISKDGSEWQSELERAVRFALETAPAFRWRKQQRVPNGKQSKATLDLINKLEETDGKAVDAASSANAENAAEPSAEAYRYFSDEAEFATDLAKEGKSAYSIFGCMIEPYLIQARQGLWNEILADYSTDKGKDLSQHERKEKAWTSSTLVYGEVAFPSFAQYLWLLYSPELTGGKYAPPPRNGGVFVDLGSGTGRALIAAALLHDFDKIVGVELLSGLHQAAVNVVKKFHSEASKGVVAARNVEVIEGDILKFDFFDADVVLANSTCFDAPLMQAIADRCVHLKNGVYVITFSRDLDAAHLVLLAERDYRHSWGVTSVFFHVKVPPRENWTPNPEWGKE